MIKYLALFSFLLFFLMTKDAAGQMKKDNELAVGAYGGVGYLSNRVNSIEQQYFDDLRLGVNAGFRAILFFRNIGIGYNYDYSHFSATGKVLAGRSIDDNFNLHYHGPLIASRVKFNEEHYIVFTASYGKSEVVNNAEIDGTSVQFKDDNWVQKFNIWYEYHFSDFAINAGVQFINESQPLPGSVRVTRLSSFFGSSTNYSYSSGVHLSRLSFQLGFSYHLSDIFL